MPTTENQSKYHASLTGKRPRTGIPSEEQLFLPPRDQLDSILEKNGALRTGTPWDAGDVLQFVFPKKYRQNSHEIAEKFIKHLRAHGGKLSSAQINAFVKESGASRATFFNVVLKRLTETGFIERQPEAGGHRVGVTWSNHFSGYLEKIAFEWKRLEPRQT